MSRPFPEPSPDPEGAASQTPLSDDDRDILAGISVMMLAIANRQNLAEQAQAALDDEDEHEGVEPLRCTTVTPDGSGSCVREPGLAGRHKFRPVNGMVN